VREQAQLSLTFDQQVSFENQFASEQAQESETETEIEVVDSPQEERIIEPKKLEEAGQILLIDIGEWWEEHWKGMPEFVQKDLTPFKTIYVHFETRKDMEAFAKLMNQPITLDTPSIWYPEAETNDFSKKRYVAQ